MLCSGRLVWSTRPVEGAGLYRLSLAAGRGVLRLGDVWGGAGRRADVHVQYRTAARLVVAVLVEVEHLG